MDMIPAKGKEMCNWDLEKWGTAGYELHIKNTTGLEFIRLGSEGYEDHSGTYLDSEQSTFFVLFCFFCMLQNSFR